MAKEAAYKAVYPLHTLTWKQLEVIKDCDGKKPSIRFALSSEDGETRSQAIKLHLSLSHDGDGIIAVVLAETSV